MWRTLILVCLLVGSVSAQIGDWKINKGNAELKSYSNPSIALVLRTSIVGNNYGRQEPTLISLWVTNGEDGDQSFQRDIGLGIRTVFRQQREESISTLDLISALCDCDPFWSEYNYGKNLSPASLARLLKPYGIPHPKLRVGAATVWGYRRSGFEDAWARYLPRDLEQVERDSKNAAETQFAELEPRGGVPALENEESLAIMRNVPSVPDFGSDHEFNSTVEFCRRQGRASVSEMVNILGLSCAEAVRHVDEMERRGLVPPAKGAGPRPFSPPTASELGFENLS